jgi:hypothetical protein
MKKILLPLIILFSFSATAQNKTWICLNEKGNVVFSIEAVSVSDFHNGLSKVYKNTLIKNAWVSGYGFIDKTGKVVIECNLPKAQDFFGPYTWVQYKNQDYFSLIDRKGNVIPTKKYSKTDYFYPFQQDVCAVYEDEKMGFVDTTGNEIIPCKYLGSTTFEDGLASVCNYNSVKGEYGYINKKGEEVIPLKFVQAGQSSFFKGLARASVLGKTVLINKEGKIVFKTLKGNIQGHNHSLITVFTKPNRKGWGWLNFKDQFVIKPEFDYANDFSEEGYAIVEKNGLNGLIDTTGKVVIDFKYETLYAAISEDGFYLGAYPGKESTTMMDAKKDFFNSNFELVNTENISYIYSARGAILMPFTDKNNKYGYLNRNFEVVIKPEYTRANPYSEGMAWVLK